MVMGKDMGPVIMGISLLYGGYLKWKTTKNALCARQVMMYDISFGF